MLNRVKYSKTATKFQFLRIGILCIGLIFSGKSIAQIDHWESVVQESDTWKYIVPSSAVDPNWTNVGFNDTGWNSGQGGFGYGDGDDWTVLPNGTISCYQRIQFTILDTNAIEAAALTIDYDDSFIAYLNGVEISRDLLTGTPAWNQTADGLHEAQAYQGNYPSQYTLLKSFLSANLIQGTNVLCVEVHNESATSSDMSSRVFLSLAMNTAGTTYSPIMSWFVPPIIFDASNLPIVVINTFGNVSIPDEPKVSAYMGIINNGQGNMNYINDPYNEYYGQIGIEIRGSSSSTFPKKAYGLETQGPDSSNYNVSIFDWPIDNDYILYAPYSDKSLIRNVLTYWIGNRMGSWAPRTQLCELVLNGEYMGVYVFMEKIKQNPGRVDIEKLKYDDISGNPLTGGYIVKIDKTTGGGVVAWTSPYTSAPPGWGPITFQLHDPPLDSLHPLQLAYIQTFITDFETALDGVDYLDPVLGYAPYIDIPSFVDFMIVNEISKNVDGYRISTFMYKDRDSKNNKLIAGPLWDFNLGWGNANYCDGGLTAGWEIDFNSVCGGGGGLQNPFYWTKLVTDPNFTHALNCRWQELRQNVLHTDTILAYIDSLALYLTDAADRNFVRWPVLGTYLWPNNFIGNTYQEEIDYLKTWTTDRMNWLDANMYGTCPDLGTEELKRELNLAIYPNPFTGQTTVTLSELPEDGLLLLNNAVGEVVLQQKLTQQSFVLDLADLTKGLYYLSVYESGELITIEKLISL